MRCSRTEAPSLHRRYPASPVLQASPPPCAAQPDPRGLSVGACHATGRASRVASVPLFHACCRHYPGGAGRCLRRSLPDPWQPSPLNRRVGFRIIGFEACTAFRTLRPAWSLSRPRRPFGVEVLQTMSLPPPSAPTVTGWSDSCRAGFAPAEEQRLLTAHCSTSTTFAARVASFRNVTHRPQKDRTASPARIGGNVPAHHRVSCPVHAGRAPRWRSRRPPRAVRNRMSPSPSGTGHRSLNPNVTPRSATGGAGGRAAGEAMPFPRQRSVVGR